MGVRRIDAKIAGALQTPDGDVRALKLEDGRELAADFFIDCTGFRGVLIEQALKTGYEDWSHWLFCDRAQAVPSARTSPLLPYTRSTALEAGWQWRIPLQHRTGNGHVYSSSFTSGRARARVAARESRRGATRRSAAHQVHHGTAQTALEPERRLHGARERVHRTARVHGHSPHPGDDPAPDPAVSARGDYEARRLQFNRSAAAEYEYIRDFIILHYYANNRVGEPFWDACRNMSIPDSLAHKIELFRETAGIFCASEDLFQLSSWLQVMWGQGVRPRGTHPFVEAIAPHDRAGYLRDLRDLFAKAAQTLPGQAEFIAKHCAATPPSAG